MSARIIELSPEAAPVTPQEIMQMESFKHLTEEQAAQLLGVFNKFCEFAFGMWSRQQKEDKQKTIVLTPATQKKAA